MLKLNFEQQLRRTLAVLHRLAEGEYVQLPDGSRIMMGEDMSIGFAVEHRDGWRISELATLDIRALNSILNDTEPPYIPVRL